MTKLGVVLLLIVVALGSFISGLTAKVIIDRHMQPIREVTELRLPIPHSPEELRHQHLLTVTRLRMLEELIKREGDRQVPSKAEKGGRR